MCMRKLGLKWKCPEFSIKTSETNTITKARDLTSKTKLLKSKYVTLKI